MKTFLHNENVAKVILGYTMTAADTEVHEVEKMFAVNVFGPMRMVHYFHKMIVQARGVIINIGSVGGIVPYIYGGRFYKAYPLFYLHKLQQATMRVKLLFITTAIH